ncbi:MAG: type II secretion system major pseudopilin GspG [Candidatus Omnitrophica bacterium]|nr:type II secretion system major pseudopilin GspG [Candidatus Omnitrophota bacterium]
MNNKKGFTLIEILLVVVILGILSGMIIPRLVGRAEETRIKVARTDIEAGLSEVLDLYELDNGKYPAALQDLLVRPAGAKNWNGPYVKKKVLPKDPWGNDYIYRFPGQNNQDGYDLLSGGPDGAEGGNDDITNWELKE